MYLDPNLLPPCTQNDNQNNLYHFSLGNYQDQYAYGICQDTYSASRRRKTMEFYMHNIPGTPENKEHC